MLRSEEHRLELLLGNLLRTGVILAATVVLAGAIFYLARHGSETPKYHTFHGEPTALRSVTGTFSRAFTLSGQGIIQVGLLLLIATPVARVAFSAYAFARLRDRRYVVITLIVLALLLFSIFGTH